MYVDTTPQVEWLYRIARGLHYQGLNSQNILHTALSLTCAAINVSQACIITFQDNGDVQDALLLGAEVDHESEFWNRLISDGLIGSVQYGQQIVSIRDVSADSRWPQLSASLRTGAAIAVPLTNHTLLCGALLLLHPQVGYFDGDICEFLEEVGGVIGTAYRNARSAEAQVAEAETARRRAEALEQQAQDDTRIEGLRRDLASMTYHDLRGLLQNIYTVLCSVEPYVNDNRIAVNLLRLATQSARQMTRMVKGLLDIDRLEQGSAVINKRRTALQPLLDDTMEQVRSFAAEARQSLSCEAAELLPDLQIDPDMITRVLVNLIENAIKHTPSNGRVTLRVKVRPDAVYFSVGDTGPGIPLGHIGEIFDKYYRIRHTDAPQGVGLGLAFCRLAVEAHGGRIWAENQPGSGAVFTFTLPLEAVMMPLA
jgi:signal transduction histidine kinase